LVPPRRSNVRRAHSEYDSVKRRSACITVTPSLADNLHLLKPARGQMFAAAFVRSSSISTVTIWRLHPQCEP
jgi:hypothetical protein